MSLNYVYLYSIRILYGLDNQARTTHGAQFNWPPLKFTGSYKLNLVIQEDEII